MSIYGYGSGYTGSQYGISGFGALAFYRTLKLSDMSPAQTFNFPVSVDQMRSYMRMTGTFDESQNDLIQDAIAAATFEAEMLQHRDLLVKTWDLTLDYWFTTRVLLGAPLISVDLFQYTDSNGVLHPMSLPNYIIDTAKSPGEILPPYGTMWPQFTPYPSSAVLIRFKSGYPPDHIWWTCDVGARVKAGIKLRASQLFFNRLPDIVNGNDSAQLAMSYGGLQVVR